MYAHFMTRRHDSDDWYARGEPAHSNLFLSKGRCPSTMNGTERASATR
jgi:hypothetical protein